MPDRANGQSAAPPMVTIGLSVLNGGSQLQYAVQSILNQTWKDWELLILDDGSTDGSIEALRFQSDPRIQIIRDGCNRGLAVRLNQAVAMAKGQYFARMDHDDICHPERLSRQVAYLEGHPNVDLLATACITINEDDQVTGCLPSAIEHEDICRRPWLGFYMPHPTWMGKVQWFRHHKYLEPAPYFSEDQELLLRSHTMSVFHSLPETLLAYRVRAQPAWKKQWRTRFTLCQTQLRYFMTRGQTTDAMRSLAALVLRMALDVWHEIVRRLSRGRSAAHRSRMSDGLAAQWKARIEAVKAAVQTHPDAQESQRV